MASKRVIQNAFKEVDKNSKYVKKIMDGVMGVNLSEDEVKKLQVLLRYEATGPLFDLIEEVYKLMASNFKSPEKVIVIPYVKNGLQYLNIQRIG